MAMDRRNLLKSAGAAAMLPMMMGDAAKAEGQVTEDTVYELRIYHLNEGKLPLILNRFKTKERPIFARCGMHEVAFWVPVEGDIPTNTLVYLMRHKSLEAAKASWKMFSADPEWVKVKAETEKDGAFVAKHDITFLKLTDFSPKI
jgi:hypothetical protein